MAFWNTKLRFFYLVFMQAVCLASGPVGADWQAGEAAMQRGDHKAALREWLPLAEQGYAKVQFNLGMMYLQGLGTDIDTGKAIEWLTKAAKSGVANAQFNLGGLYARGVGTDVDPGLAVDWFRQAAEQGHADAAYLLASAYAGGRGITQNDVEAVKWFRKAALFGNPQAQNDLGGIYSAGVLGQPQDMVEAAKWFRLAAEQNFPVAQANLALMYIGGQGVEQDEKVAVDLFRKAAEAGFDKAQFNLGLAYLAGLSVNQDQSEAINWFKKAAQQGHEKAQLKLAELGEDVGLPGNPINRLDKSASEEPRTEQKLPAKEFVAKSSATPEIGLQGESRQLNKTPVRNQEARILTAVSPSYVQPGELSPNHERGEVAESTTLPTAAEKSLDINSIIGKAKTKAEEGNPNDQYYLAGLYFQGTGIEKDLSLARYWFTKAATQGHRKAQYLLGSIYLKGLGIEANEEVGLHWLLLSAEQGYGRALYQLGLMKHRDAGEGDSSDNRAVSADYFYRAGQAFVAEGNQKGAKKAATALIKTAPNSPLNGQLSRAIESL